MPDSDYSNALVIVLYKITALTEGNYGERHENAHNCHVLLLP